MYIYIFIEINKGSDDDSKPAVESLPINKSNLFYSMTRSKA